MICRIIHIPILRSTFGDDFACPIARELATVQENNRDSLPLSAIQGADDTIWRTASSAICILQATENFEFRLCVIPHTRPVGHRGPDFPLRTLRNTFMLPAENADMSVFFEFIHCFSPVGGAKEPRLFGPAFHGTKANNVLRIDYI